MKQKELMKKVMDILKTGCGHGEDCDPDWMLKRLSYVLDEYKLEVRDELITRIENVLVSKGNGSEYPEIVNYLEDIRLEKS